MTMTKLTSPSEENSELLDTMMVRLNQTVELMSEYLVMLPSQNLTKYRLSDYYSIPSSKGSVAASAAVWTTGSCCSGPETEVGN